MKNTPMRYGLILTVVTLVLFFIVYFCFIGFNYYLISLRVNFFVLPAIYTLFAVILLYKKTNRKKLSFADCFSTSFVTMFVGGTLSFLFIVLFLNYIDPGAHELFGHQLYGTLQEGLEQDYGAIVQPAAEDIEQYHQSKKILNWLITEQKYFFGLRTSLIILGILYTFYLIISVFLSMFFRLRIPHATIHSNTPS